MLSVALKGAEEPAPLPYPDNVLRGVLMTSPAVIAEVVELVALPREALGSAHL